MSSFTPINRRASEDDTCRQTTSSEGRTTTYQQLPHDENTTQEQLPQDEDTTYRQSPRDDKISPTASSGPTSRGWTLPPRGGTQRRGDSNVSQRDTAAVSRSEDSKLTQCRSASKYADDIAIYFPVSCTKLSALEAKAKGKVEKA
ncbi:uncharacterized protein I206_106454 [Kwoniella pini CBS 10737]|uniref:Uncharacterized protein n=1 Tax=Kwoniella pini CBS 10737 TaxID=1296096 RepID=A0A1B9HUC5_9TREE|nr:uncharacterized protein I206_07258 [Kwoniella pini CBS 10737]OCF46871.1 hypothetical protein I206_07258 [Kwoniella pini CBS 10737]